MSFVGSIDSRSENVVFLAWGCELSSHRTSYTFEGPQEWHCEDHLALHTMFLKKTAPDEFHEVEVLPAEGHAAAPVSLAVLKPSVQITTTLGGMRLTPPVTFHLRRGSGPLCICGEHVTTVTLSSDEEETEEELESAEDTPERPPRGASAQNGSTAKKGKPEKKDELNKTNPKAPNPSKGRRAGRGRKATPKN